MVFTIRTDVDEAFVDGFIQRTAEVRGVSVETLKAYRDVIVGFLARHDQAATRHWAARQAYIALGNLMTSAAAIGVDVCPMEGLDPAKYDETLGLARQNLATVVAAAVGFRAADDKYASLPKVRAKVADVVAHL